MDDVYVGMLVSQVRPKADIIINHTLSASNSRYDKILHRLLPARTMDVSQRNVFPYAKHVEIQYLVPSKS